MPFRITDENFEAVIRTHLAEGEELLTFFGVPRKVVGLTNQRLLVSNFPFFFAPKVLLEVPVQSIVSLDFQMTTNNVVLQVSDGSVGHTEKLQSIMHDVPKLLNEVFDKVKELNPNVGGAAYFEDGEQELFSLPTDDGTFKLTDKHLFMVGTKISANGMPEDLRKIRVQDITEFDCYESTMGSLRIYVAHSGGRDLFKVGSMAVTSHVQGDVGVHDDSWTPELIARALPNARPAHLNGETPLFTMRAAKSKMGAIKPGYQLRMTATRMLLLEANKTGELTVVETFNNSELGKPSVTRHLGQHKELLNLEATFQNGFNFFAPGESETAFKGLVAKL